jgi:hypothetical protein
MMNSLLLLLALAQFSASQLGLSFDYKDVTACRNRVVAWDSPPDEIVSITLPIEARRIKRRSFPIGTKDSMVRVRLYWGGRGFANCGEDLGTPFEESLANRSGATATRGTATVSVSDGDVVTVVLRNLRFEWWGEPFEVDKPIRVTLPLNHYGSP